MNNIKKLLLMIISIFILFPVFSKEQISINVGDETFVKDMPENYEEACEMIKLLADMYNDANDEINKLPEPDKEIIYLRYFEDKTQSEVANILGLNQVAVSRNEQKTLLKNEILSNENLLDADLINFIKICSILVLS